MSNWKESIINSLKWVWQFPQNMLAVCLEGILGGLATRAFKITDKKITCQVIFCYLFKNALTLGNYIFISNEASVESKAHSFEHARQSYILGPLYLIVIGIPSMLYNIVYTVGNKLGFKWDYYKFYTEHWLMRKD